MSEHKELCHKYRPKNLKDVVGQESAMRILSQYVEQKRIPHALMLQGTSGSGKTTTARILKDVLECGDQDFYEINCATVESALDTVRSIQQRMGMASIGGKSRIWVLDEVQSLSRSAFSQQGLLKILEDGPRHCYFILATTDPNKVIKTVRDRCTIIQFKAIQPKTISNLLISIIKKEKGKVSEEVIDKIVEISEGSARRALVLLDKIIGIKDEEEQLSSVVSEEYQKKAEFLGKLLLNPRTKWNEVAKVLKENEEEPENLRRGILGFAAAVLMSGKVNPRAFQMLTAFECDFFNSGKGGLVRACYEVIVGG